MLFSGRITAMPMPFRCLHLLTLCATLLFAAPTPAQKNTVGMQDRESERRSLAVNLVRAINSAEGNYKRNHGSYASWDILLGNGDFSEAGTKWAPESFPAVAHAMYGRGPEIVPGWRIRLQLSKDGNAYDVLLEDVTDTKCGFAVFSDDRGLTRQGKFIDCPL
jgi:hypothetical protein